MSNNAINPLSPAADRAADPRARGNLLLGTGLVFASLILVPAFAGRLGLGSSLTGALRIALMRASAKAIGGKTEGSEGTVICTSCH